MIGTNHILAGATIGLVAGSPIVALACAFLSHFLLDALPHFGFKGWGNRSAELKRKIFRTVIITDTILMGLVLGVLAAHSSLLALAAGVVAFLPDTAWVYRFVVHEKYGKNLPRPKNWFNALHARIQWYEKPLGFIFEILIFIILGNSVWRLV